MFNNSARIICLASVMYLCRYDETPCWEEYNHYKWLRDILRTLIINNVTFCRVKHCLAHNPSAWSWSSKIGRQILGIKC